MTTMRKLPLLGSALLVPALSLCLSVTGCSNKPAEAPKGGGAATNTTAVPADNKKAETKEAGGAAGGKEMLTAPTNGTVKGYVKYDGTPPKLIPNDKIKEHNDKATCLMGSDFEKSEQVWLVGKDNGVANVLVYLTPPAGKIFDTKNPAVKKPFEHNAVLDQPHCAFIPHVLALYPAAGQKLEVKNSAPISHNTKIVGDPLYNPSPLDKNLPPKSDEIVPLKYQKEPLGAVCNQHPWMNAIIFTFNNPYFAVTKDDGSFAIDNVPTGVELHVMTWHESMGKTLKDAKEAEKKSFKSGDNDVTLKVK
jgi:hypothetical protein